MGDNWRDLELVGTLVDNEDEGVVVLNLLHGRLCITSIVTK